MGKGKNKTFSCSKCGKAVKEDSKSCPNKKCKAVFETEEEDEDEEEETSKKSSKKDDKKAGKASDKKSGKGKKDPDPEEVESPDDELEEEDDDDEESDEEVDRSPIDVSEPKILLALENNEEKKFPKILEKPEKT